ncbi:MAG: TetR/AcrR family transcriptional regulator [Planctomycetes bacterium]|nr:TetR/AcrR family transcriptional regulator [Planctomycetota bacterium]
MAKRRARATTDRRGELLAAARWVFAKKGYHESSVDDVIRRAGVARGTFYLYFDGKRPLFGEVLEGVFQRIWETVPPIRTGPGDDVRAQVLANLGALVSLFEDDPAVPRIVLSVALGVDFEADRALAGFYRSCRERLAAALEKGQALGIVGDGDPTLLAITLMGTLKEYWTQRLLGTDPPPLPQLMAEIGRLFRTGWLRGEGRGAKRSGRARRR